MELVGINEKHSFSFSLQRCLSAYLWAHAKTPNCQQTSRTDKLITFEIKKDLPALVAPILGKSILISEETVITPTEILSTSTGSVANTKFTSIMTFTGDDTQSSVQIQVLVDGIGSGNELYYQGINTFILSEINQWCNQLPSHLAAFELSTN